MSPGGGLSFDTDAGEPDRDYVPGLPQEYLNPAGVPANVNTLYRPIVGVTDRAMFDRTPGYETREAMQRNAFTIAPPGNIMGRDENTGYHGLIARQDGRPRGVQTAWDGPRRTVFRILPQPDWENIGQISTGA